MNTELYDLHFKKIKLTGFNLTKKTLSLFFNNFLPILSLVLIVALPVEFIKNYYFVSNHYDESFFKISGRDSLVNVFFLTLLTPSIIFFFNQKFLGNKISVINCLGYGIKRWPRLIVYGIVTHIIIAAGFILLIVPGIIFSIRLLFVSVMVSLDELDPIGESRLLSKGRFWKILLNILIFVGVVLLPLLILSTLVYWFVDGWVSDFLYDTLTDIFTTTFTIFTLLLYVIIKRDTGENIS